MLKSLWQNLSVLSNQIQMDLDHLTINQTIYSIDQIKRNVEIY